MSAGTFEMHAERGRSDAGAARFDLHDRAPRTPAEPLLTYDLTVVATDVSDVVASAGGWLCDRVRAGWQVTVVVPPGGDLRALQIMGVQAETDLSAIDALRGGGAAAWAVAAALLDADPVIRREVTRAVEQASTEVTVWGGTAFCTSGPRFAAVRHRLSAAARAFKKHAQVTAGRGADVSAVEDFHSAALWYGTDGADLVPISAGE